MINIFRRSLTAMAEGPKTKMIKEKLKNALNPDHLNVVCESHMHAVPKGAEMHFLVECVSKKFEDLPKIKCHRIIHDVLADELKSGDIHALRLFTIPPSKYTGQFAPPAPKCEKNVIVLCRKIEYRCKSLLKTKILLHTNTNYFSYCNYFQKSRVLKKNSILITQNPKEDFTKVIKPNRKIGLQKVLLQKIDLQTHNSKLLIDSKHHLRAKLSIFIKNSKIIKTMDERPSMISLEILRNGFSSFGSSVLIRTNKSLYVINFPEGLLRYAAMAKIKTFNIKNVFITRNKVSNFGGLPGFITTCLERISINDSINTPNFHGITKIIDFTETLLPVITEDKRSQLKKEKVNIMTKIPCSKEQYSDEAFDIRYIPIMESGTSNINAFCYLFEAKPPRKNIDPFKLQELDIPRGSWIGELKNGKTVTLPDNRVIKPEDVFVDLKNALEKPNVLILDIESIDEINCLLKSKHFLPYMSKKKSLNFVVHMVKDHIIKSEEYQKFMNIIHCQNAKNIILNETAEFYPSFASIYHLTTYCNSICPEVFPPLYKNDSSLSFSNKDYENNEDTYLTVKPYARFLMRGFLREDFDINISLDVATSNFKVPEKEKDDFNNLVNTFREECKNDELLTNGDIYPELIVLGTSSALQTKYRNVSSYLFKTSENSFFLIDIGESTYEQLFYYYGSDEVEKVLMNIKACFITHAHQDHVNGFLNIVLKRKAAFEKHKKEYIPLVVSGTYSTIRYIKGINIFFTTVLDFIEIIFIDLRYLGPVRFLPSLVMDIEQKIPSYLYDKESWHLSSIKSVPVEHTSFSCGYVLTTTNGRKFVFSGDTKPCEIFISEGMNADVLVHEATFDDEHEKEAFRKRHSTMKQAITVGEKMKAKHILLTHFSARYSKIPKLPDYLIEKNNVGIAFDFMTIKFKHWQLVPKLNKIYRKAFSTELEELEIKTSKRNLALESEEFEEIFSTKDILPNKRKC
ncbi:Zinc phosphodiesterase ELAC protein 2 [Strongyloides ratti]|uniref:ribonuclease Z n=1 Tax=Strongyloides ratti TaxID=34506 RepID=A0A090L9V0_STRRB|nr:Zinc phosphodiesterase ELAC protein 2 [Strongyloides ratti]CEF64260.1 Zinc phosphodiesterase ELAC protein 2 [Strongyloides ratti]